MSKIDQKTRNQLIDALEGAKEYHRQLDMKRQEKLWKKMDTPFALSDILPMLTKAELDDIRKQLDLSGMSTLKKAELAEELAKLIPTRLEKVISTFDQERYQLVKNLIGHSGAMPIDEIADFNIRSLMSHGIVFPILKDGQKQLAVPVEIIDQFAEVGGDELQERIRQNTEWIRLIHGMIYYYGVMESSKMLDKIEAFSKGAVDYRQYYDVLWSAKDYYNQIRFSHGGYIIDDSIFDEEDLIKEHKSRPEVDYYPFTKKQLLKAGEPGFIEKSPEMLKFLRFLSEEYELTTEDKDEIADQLFYMINADAKPSMLIEYLQTMLETPSFEVLQQITAFIMTVYNDTRMWALKGHKPTEVRKEKENTIPTALFNQPQGTSNVIDMNTRQKVGRNDPCPCGSGKKYKKCCGR